MPANIFIATVPLFELISMKMNALYAKRRLLFFAFCFFLAATTKAQTGVVVTYYDGSQQTYSVATAGKLYFSSGNLQIMSTGVSSPVSIPVSIIRKLTFSAAPLPIRLTDFTLLNEKAQVSLSWKTANEVNAAHFIIERSADGTSFESIGQVAALNSSTGGSYSFADVLPKTGITYYRLKQVDADGKYEYSKVLTVKRSAADVLITLLPNPAANYISINSSSMERLNVKIFSADGRLMISGSYASGEHIAVSKLAPGMYIATINDKTYKIVKQ